ncbi:flippase [Mangrovimonas cancribranchiae]|uniref:Flippase n=1 Tax=Mangrovimonas cancribranchiae TaxID=3080055 RepID=A0AAU6NX65_9FLAO
MITKIKNKANKLLTIFDLEKLFVNSGNVFLRRVLGLVLSFLWIMLTTNLFGAEVYGLVSLGQMFISFGAMFFGLGLETAIVKLGSTNDHYFKGVLQSNFLKKSIILTFVASLVFGVLLYFFKDLIAIKVFNNQKFSNYLLFISIFFFMFVLHKTTASFLTVQEKFTKFGNYYFLFPNLLILICVLIAYQFQLPGYYIILGFLFSYGIFGLILLFSFFNIPLNIKKSIGYKSILSLSTPMMISASFLFISNWTDTFMLGAMVSKSELGVYNVAFKLASLALIIIASVNTVLAPKISKLFSDNNIEGIKREVQKATKLITWVAFPLVMILILFRTKILLLFGDEFVVGGQTLVIISLGMLFNAMSGSVGQVLNMTNNQKQFRNFTLISAFINVILNFYLIKSLGIKGAAIASLISNVLLNTLCIIYIKKTLGFFSFFKFKY